MRGYDVNISDTNVTLTKKCYNYGAFLLLAVVPPILLLLPLILFLSSDESFIVSFILLVVFTAIDLVILIPSVFLLAAVAYVTETLQADRDGIRFTRKSNVLPKQLEFVASIIPNLEDRHVQYRDVKECGFIKNVTKHKEHGRVVRTVEEVKFQIKKTDGKYFFRNFVCFGPTPTAEAVQFVNGIHTFKNAAST